MNNATTTSNEKNSFKVIIAGSRTFSNFDMLCKYCNNNLENESDIEIVSGGARGADKLGEKYANNNKYPIKRFPAEWNKYGKSAGYIRNAQMAKYADALIAFWDGKSRGTKNMIDQATKNGLFIHIHKYDKK